MISLSWLGIAVWGVFVAASAALLTWDFISSNRATPRLMKAVWILVVLYSGPLGLVVYWSSGRRQIKDDAMSRRAWRSNAHCFSGCGLGEVVGVLLATQLGLGSLGVTVLTFLLAYTFGYLLTIGPLLQDNVPMMEAIRDALYSETASITAMEISALAVDLGLTFGIVTVVNPLFWVGLVSSLIIGFLVAYPINLLLVKQGVKKGMMNPRKYPVA